MSRTIYFNKANVNWSKLLAPLLTWAAILFSSAVSAQNTGTIRASVVDENNAPIEFANVLLFSDRDTTKVLSSAYTDSLGSFALKQIGYGAYQLKISMLGYLSSRVEVQLNGNNNNMDLRSIQLILDAALFKNVEIVSHRDIIKKTTQGFIVEAKDNLVQAGGTATDLLKNTPTVVVDAEGGITIRGKAPLILVNGRNSSLASTDRIPASSVESIEIINNPNSKYDADSDGGIINIKLKKGMTEGFNCSIAVAGGLGAKGRASSSAILNYNRGKWNLGLAYDNRFAARVRKRQASRTDYEIPDNYYLQQHRLDNRDEKTHNLKLNIDFQPNARNTWVLELIGNGAQEFNDETLYSMFRTQANEFSSNNSRISLEKFKEKIAEYAFNYQRSFDDERQYFTSNLSTSFDFDSENTDITTQSLFENDFPTGSPVFQRTYNYQHSSVTNLKLDYGQPISPRSLLEFGYKGIARFTNADFQNQFFSDGQYIKNPRSSNIFDFKEQIHAGYFQLSSCIGPLDSAKWKYDIGVRVEQVYNQGKGASNNLFVKRNYFNLFPAYNLSYHLNKSDYVKMSFSRRIDRPDLEDLNPFVDITDSLNQHGGNPYLRPELINAFELGHFRNGKNVSISSTLFYRYATQIIRSFIALDSNGVALSRPVNFGNATTFGMEEMISIFPSKLWNTNLSFSLYQQNISGANVSEEIDNSILSWYGKLINNFAVSKGGQLQLIGSYNSAIGTPQGKKLAIYFIDMGFRQSILKGKGALSVVVTDVFNTQRSGYTAAAFNYSYSRYFKIDTRALMLTFAYSFGTIFKEDLLENKFTND
jgi:hypothetical protein